MRNDDGDRGRFRRCSRGNRVYAVRDGHERLELLVGLRGKNGGRLTGGKEMIRAGVGGNRLEKGKNNDEWGSFPTERRRRGINGGGRFGGRARERVEEERGENKSSCDVACRQDAAICGPIAAFEGKLGDRATKGKEKRSKSCDGGRK